MIRLRRRATIILSALSLLVAVVAAGLGLRAVAGGWTPVRIARVGGYDLTAIGHRLWLLRDGKQVTHDPGPPLVAVAGAFAVLPAVTLFLTRGERRRRAAGACEACGYDLRATPEPGGALLDRCPECGAARGRA